MDYKKYLKSKVRPINEMYDKGDMVYFYNDAGEKVLGRVLSVNGNIYTIDYNGDTYQTNDVMSESVKAYKKGDIVSFHNDMKKMVQGRIISVSGDKVVIDVHGIKFKRTMYDLRFNDHLGEAYGIGYGLGYSSGYSLTDPPDSDAHTAASVAGDDSDVAKKVSKVVDMVSSGDVEGAAKKAANHFLRYGRVFTIQLKSKLSDNKSFWDAYEKAKEDLKNGVKDKPIKKDAPKDSDETN